LTARHLLLHLGELKEATPEQLDAVREYLTDEGWKSLYNHDRRMWRLLRDGVQRLESEGVPGVDIPEKVRIATALGFEMTVMFIKDRQSKSPNE